MLTVVVARTYRQFEDWCRSQGINPKHPRAHNVLYASEEQAIRGIAPHSARVVYTGTPRFDMPEAFWLRIEEIALPLA